MAANDLNNPLTRKPRRPSARRPVIAPLLVATALLLAATAALWVALVDDPDGGRPAAVAMITESGPAATGSLSAAEEAPPPIADERPDPLELAALPGVPGAAGPGLLEPSAFGLLPRVAPDGRRPREVYAADPPPAAQGAPRIAIVVGGMGISQTGTQRAIEALPEGVTLAFASHGGSLQRWVDAARAEGHEVLLQIPLEPLGYPQQNPGEHTLVAAAGAGNIRRELEWNLARMTAYAGVMNHMGAGFTADEQAVATLLGEIGARGLYYLDDGSARADPVASVGEALGVPVLFADTLVDQQREATAIRARLDALETLARGGRPAVAVASAFPTSVEAIAAWIDEARARGVVIVPASAALKP